MRVDKAQGNALAGDGGSMLGATGSVSTLSPGSALTGMPIADASPMAGICIGLVLSLPVWAGIVIALR